MNRNNDLNLHSNSGTEGDRVFLSEDFYQVYPMTAKVAN